MKGWNNEKTKCINLRRGGGSYLNGCVVPVPVRVSETGRARNWTMPPLRPERECRERANRASVDNTCKGFDRRENQRCAFTMAEILLSLTIIGVVAAITLPSLTGNINERTWNTQKKALYARMSQAVALMPNLNGYGTATETANSSGSMELTVDNVAETFVTSGLAKVLKINNICDSEHLTDCGLPQKLTTMVGSNSNFPTTNKELSGVMVKSVTTSGSLAFSAPAYKAAAFETANGESVAVYYNPNCQSAMGETDVFFVQDKLCMVGLYDLNGSKGPNTIGKDMGIMAALYPVDSVVVLPLPSFLNSSNSNLEDSRTYCRNISGENGNRLPNREEAAVMAMTRTYYVNAADVSGNFWTSGVSEVDPSKGWSQGFGGDTKVKDKTSPNTYSWCVKR